MIPEIGQFALVLALCMALLQGFAPLTGGYGNGAAAAGPDAKTAALALVNELSASFPTSPDP